MKGGGHFPTQQSVVGDIENLPEKQLDGLLGNWNRSIVHDSIKLPDSINPEEEYFSKDDSEEDNEEGNSDDEVEGGGVLDSENNFEDEDNMEIKEEEDHGHICPIDVNEAHFVESTRNLYREEDVGEDTVEPELPALVIGMEWPTMKNCRDFLKNLAIQKRYAMKQLANKAMRQHYVCKDVNCKWEVYASTLSDGLTMRLRHGHFEHTCQADSQMKNMLANARWVANTIIEDVRNHPHYKLKDIAQDVLHNYHVSIPYWTAWNARVMCLEKIFGNYEESYKMGPEICIQMLKTNPGSIATVSRTDETQEFKALCVSLKASLDGFVAGCRPILGLDGCFLKGKYGGMSLSIVTESTAPKLQS